MILRFGDDVKRRSTILRNPSTIFARRLSPSSSLSHLILGVETRVAFDEGRADVDATGVGADVKRRSSVNVDDIRIGAVLE